MLFYKLLIATLFFTTAIFAAKPCKNVEIKNDPFSKKQVVESERFLQYDSYNAIKFKIVDEQYFISYRLTERGDVDQVLPAGYTLPIAFEDGNVIELKNDKDIKPVARVGGSHIYTDWTVTFIVERETVAQFANSRIKTMKIKGISKEEYNAECSGNLWLKAIHKQAQCFVCDDCF